MRYLFLILLLPGLLWAAEAEQGQAIGSKSMTMPTENVDGSTLTDLAEARLWWTLTSMDYDISRTVTRDATIAGATEVVPFVISLTAEIGEVVTIFFVGTAIDEVGNESARGFKLDGTESAEQFLVVDNIGPRPPVMVLDFPFILDVHSETGNQLSAIPYHPLAMN